MLLILAKSQLHLVELYSDVRPYLKMATFAVPQSCGSSEMPAARITHAKPERAACSVASTSLSVLSFTRQLVTSLHRGLGISRYQVAIDFFQVSLKCWILPQIGTVLSLMQTFKCYEH